MPRFSYPPQWGAAVDIEQIDLAQQLAAGGLNAVLQGADRDTVIADQCQVTGGRGIFGQRRIDRIRRQKLAQCSEIQLSGINFTGQAVIICNQRVDLSKAADSDAVDQNGGTAAWMIAVVVRDVPHRPVPACQSDAE